jgi:hypothetical protein
MRRPWPALDTLSLLRAAVLSFAYMSGQATYTETKLHYAPNHDFAPDGSFLPAGARFNLADVSRLRESRPLTPGGRTLVWIGRCGGVDRDFLRIVRAYAGNRNLTSIILMNVASTLQPSFKETYEPSNSHVDLAGLAAYPCRSDVSNGVRQNRGASASGSGVAL